MIRPSSLTDPLTDEEVDLANKEPSDLWIHVRCKICGDVEPCFNRSEVAWTKTCFPCLMGWKSNAPIAHLDRAQVSET
jgi:hypothetical protein